MQLDPALAIYAVPLVAVWLVFAARRRMRESHALSLQNAAAEAGLTEPASLHPRIDPALCLGCGACVRACPEGEVLGLIGGKAALVEPTQCIGHGACKAACPFDAISLVFGTATRGIDLPHVGPNFETNVPGLFVAGELGGMGLIRNAVEQGRQAVASVSRLDGLGRQDQVDLIIVGAGPAGISAGLAATEQKLSCITLEQDSPGGTVAHFPRGKLVMTQPAILPIVGKMRFREVSKERLLAFWQRVIRQHELRIDHGVRVDAIRPRQGGFDVMTTHGVLRARAVLLAIGRRGTPRRLDVPGEDLPKVVYRLTDPEQYRGQHVLVVGGGDSALEAAASLAEEPGTHVTLSYRSAAFGRAKLKNRERVESAVQTGRLELLLKTRVIAIHPDRVEIEEDRGRRVLRNDAVIICAGGILPTEFLKKCGIRIETKHGTA